MWIMFVQYLEKGWSKYYVIVFASFMWLQCKILFCCECGLMYQFWKSLLRIFTIDPSVPFLHKTRRKYFAFYADTCFASFGDRVKHWITLNDSKQQSWSWHWDFCTWKTWTTHRRNLIRLRTPRTWPMQQLFPCTEARTRFDANCFLLEPSVLSSR